MSVRKRTWKNKDGSIGVAFIADYTDQSGERHPKQFPTQREAKAYELKAKGEVAKGVHTAQRRDSKSLADAGKLHLQWLKGEGRRPSTLHNYGELIRLHINPQLGTVKLPKLTRPMVEEWRDNLLATGKRVTAKRTLVLLYCILENAVRLGWVNYNVARGVEIKQPAPAKKVAGRDLPTPQEGRMIVDAAAENFPFLIVTACTGMRKGELRALRWEDVDFERGVIMVRHNASRWNTMGPTKSISGERTIQMWPIVEYTLREWKEICPRGRTPGFYTPEHTVLKIGKFLAENPGISDKKVSKHFGVCHLTVRHVRKVMPFPEKGPPEFVFPNRSGGIQDGSNVWRQFRRLQRKLGMTDDATAHGRPKYSPHHLRHFFASWEMNQGRPILDLARELGHKDASMILKVYGHAFDDPDAARVRAHASQAALLGSPRPQQN